MVLRAVFCPVQSAQIQDPSLSASAHGSLSAMRRPCDRVAPAQMTRQLQDAFVGGTTFEDTTKKLKVQMSGKKVDDSTMGAWCNWLKSKYHHDITHVSVMNVDFSNNLLTAAGMALLLDLLHSTRLPVRLLKLYQNRIQSGNAIVEYLSHCQGHLQQLHMSHNLLAQSDIVDIMMAAIAARRPCGKWVYSEIARGIDASVAKATSYPHDS